MRVVFQPRCPHCQSHQEDFKTYLCGTDGTGEGQYEYDFFCFECHMFCMVRMAESELKRLNASVNSEVVYSEVAVSSVPAVAPERNTKTGTIKYTTQDHRFLKALKIAVGEDE